MHCWRRGLVFGISLTEEASLMKKVIWVRSKNVVDVERALGEGSLGLGAGHGDHGMGEVAWVGRILRGAALRTLAFTLGSLKKPPEHHQQTNDVASWSYWLLC